MPKTLDIQRIEENFRTFADKYQDLFSDLKTGLQSMGKLYGDYLQQLQSMLDKLAAEDFSQASKIFASANLQELLEEDFSDNLKLKADIDTLKARLANLGMVETA